MLRAWCCVVLVPAFLRAAATVPDVAVNNVLTHRRCKADCSSLGFLQCNVLLPLTRSGDANRTTATATTDDSRCGWLSARQWCAPRARHAIRRVSETRKGTGARASLTSTGHLTDVGVDQDALSPRFQSTTSAWSWSTRDCLRVVRVSQQLISSCGEQDCSVQPRSRGPWPRLQRSLQFGALGPSRFQLLARVVGLRFGATARRPRGCRSCGCRLYAR